MMGSGRLPLLPVRCSPGSSLYGVTGKSILFKWVVMKTYKLQTSKYHREAWISHFQKCGPFSSPIGVMSEDITWETMGDSFQPRKHQWTPNGNPKSHSCWAFKSPPLRHQWGCTWESDAALSTSDTFPPPSPHQLPLLELISEEGKLKQWSSDFKPIYQMSTFQWKQSQPLIPGTRQLSTSVWGEGSSFSRGQH